MGSMPNVNVSRHVRTLRTPGASPCESTRPLPHLQRARRCAGAALGTVALVLVGCGSSGGGAANNGHADGTTTAPTTPASTSTGPTTTTPSPGAVPPTATYANGPAGTPHTYIVVTDRTGDTFTGTVAFLYQDGMSTTEFGFSATAHAGTATLTTTGGGPGMISATYSQSTLVLPGCSAFLAHSEPGSNCTFTSSAQPPD